MKPLSVFVLGSMALIMASAPAIVWAQATDPNAPLPTGSNASRPAQNRTPSLPFVTLPPLSLAEVSQEMTARLLRLPGVRAVSPVTDTPNLLRLIAHNDSLVRLDALMDRLNAPSADRESEYRRLQTNIAAMLIRTDPFKPEQLRIVIRPTTAIDTFETESAAGDLRNVVVRRPFINGLEEVVVGDTPNTIALMPASRLADLQLNADQAFERGRANTITQTNAITWRTIGGVLEVRATSGYDTSLLALDPVWEGLAQRLGGPVAVIVPTREKIVVGRADRPRDIARLRAILTTEAKGARMLSTKIWVKRGAVWVER